jgi:hypothetical protein
MQIVRRGAILILCVLAAVVCAFSYRFNNPSFPELAGEWRIVHMNNVTDDLRFSMTEHLKFVIDPRGLLGNIGTQFTMVIVPGECGDGCYKLHDNFNPVGPGWLYTLKRGETADRLYIHIRPPADAVITLERVVN